MDEAKAKTKRLREPTPGYLFLAFGLCILLWVLNWIYGDTLGSAAGEFGDRFGMINALFTGLSLAGVIYAILVQRYEVSLAKEDLDRTKDLLDEQSEHLKEQNEASKKQQFEATFFKMLEIYETTVQETEIAINIRTNVSRTGRNSETKEVLRKGNIAFKFLLEEIVIDISNINFQNNDWLDRHFRPIFYKFIKERDDVLPKYFRIVFRVIDFVDKSSIQDKLFYTNIINSMMTDHEIGLIFFNCLAAQENRPFKELIEKYALLQYLSHNHHDLYHPFKTEYSLSAYGK